MARKHNYKKPEWEWEAEGFATISKDEYIKVFGKKAYDKIPSF